MTAPPLFSPRVLTALVSTIAVAFLGSLLLTGYRGEVERSDTVGANSYSRSAIGHAGFFEVLRSTGIRVVRAQNDPLARLGTDGVLVLAEPTSNLASDLHRSKLSTATAVLLVLPKWIGRRSTTRRDWIGGAELISIAAPRVHFRAVATKGEIVRVASPSNYSVNELRLNPQVAGPLQLVKDSDLRPLIATSDGVLLGEIFNRDRRIAVLSDPDIIENHGIGRSDNAALAVALIERLRRQDGLAVFDETIHSLQDAATGPAGRSNNGIQSDRTNIQPSFLIFSFPYWLIGLQAMVALALLLLASTGRFGAPRLRPAALGIDKRALITNTARLIDFGGHHAALLRRYVQINLQDAAKALHAPRGLSTAALILWLDQASKKRGATSSAGALIAEMNSAASGDLSRQFASVRKLLRWRKELVNGPARGK